MVGGPVVSGEPWGISLVSQAVRNPCCGAFALRCTSWHVCICLSEIDGIVRVLPPRDDVMSGSYVRELPSSGNGTPEPGLTSLARLGVSYDEGAEGLGDPAQVAQVSMEA